MHDGRRLAFSEYGDRNGHPNFCFHGFPGSRLEASLADEAAAEAGVRLIAADRPGFGRSDPQRDRSLLDWPVDVARLANALELPSFTVIGVSAGGAYALPEHLDAVGMVSGLAPLDRSGLLDGMQFFNRSALLAARRVPWLLRLVLPFARMIRVRPAAVIDLLARRLGGQDAAVLSRPEVRTPMSNSLAESLRQGTRGHVDELLLCHPVKC